jgi:hypothetical protein
MTLASIWTANANGTSIRNPAVILHAEVADSTALVRHNEQLAHDRIQHTLRNFGDIISKQSTSLNERFA